ncbi:MAG TPA: hypothetical protein VFQ58_07880, partial [Flavisolibacter sp.]|nr:hypothetical protein [Flavisolibacter sp.]
MIYIILPGTIKIKASTGIKCTRSEFNACIQNMNNWVKWFPADKESLVKKDSFYFKQYSYLPGQQLTNGAEIEINGKLKLNSQLITYNLRPDSIIINWSTAILAGNNPFKRIEYYFEAIHLKNNMDVILDSLKNYAVKPINVYGFNIKMETFGDSLLVSTKKTFATSPTVNDVYEIINNLHTYINSSNAAVVDSPMIHIKNTGTGQYSVSAAIAIDHLLPENSTYSIIRMVINNRKYISADVYGGPGTVENAHK